MKWSYEKKTLFEQVPGVGQELLRLLLLRAQQKPKHSRP